jgi:hypothetical protein
MRVILYALGLSFVAFLSIIISVGLEVNIFVGFVITICTIFASILLTEFLTWATGR